MNNKAVSVRGTNIKRDWEIIFISTVALIVIVAAASVLTFVKIDKGEIFVSESGEEKSQILDISKLRDIVSYHSDKTLEFEKIKSEKSSAVDPSI